MTKTLQHFACVACAAFLITGCARDPRVTRNDPTLVGRADVDLDEDDRRQMVTAMAEKISTDPNVTGVQGYPTILTARIQNRTSEHLDTRSIVDNVKTELLRRGQFNFVDLFGTEDYNKDVTVDIARKYGADYILYGTIAGDNRRFRNEEIRDYRMTMTLVSVLGNRVLWQDDKPLRKTIEKRLIGF